MARTHLGIVYGACNRILPDRAQTMARAGRDLPQAHVTVPPDGNHRLPAGAPVQGDALLAEFFAAATRPSALPKGRALLAAVRPRLDRPAHPHRGYVPPKATRLRRPSRGRLRLPQGPSPGPTRERTARAEKDCS